MIQQIVDSAISTSLSHIQVHQPGFPEHKEINLTIPEGMAVLNEMKRFPGIKSATGRSIMVGMASTSATATGVEIYGIDPVSERTVTDIHKKIKEGTYFSGNKRNPIVIGRKMAERLKAKIGSKIVITAQAPDGSICAGAFRVVGIYKTETSVFDEVTAFTLRTDIDRIFGLNGQINEIAALVQVPDQVDTVRNALSQKFPGLQVESWKQISTIMAYYTDMGIQMMDISMLLILLTMVFGITNTMLMSVVERVRELGVVMALGMKHSRIFIMIILESIILSLTGGILGIIIGAISIEILGKYGLDLSAFSEALAAFGAIEITYAYVPITQYPKIILMVIITATVSAIFPAIKAIRLSPIKAIRTY
jgi:ABC-type lipoprotein release transport system permease subunit